MTPQFCGYDVWLEEQDSPLLVKKREEEGKASQEAAAALGAKGGAVETIVSDPGPNPRGVRPREFHSLDRFGYRPTALYAFPPPFDGPRLGLAMGVSGAAASPNMGFYSSAPVAFLMTLFDVRLGQWLGNPRHRVTWQRATPIFGLPYLLNELFAGTDDEAAYVYLSDGGHFENMGLYELVKRRCGLIIVCDAEADDCYGFAGLGNAIRKCRIDLGIDVVLDVSDITPKKTGEPSAKHCAIGKIHYEAVDKSAPAGTIIYFKASVTGDESTDIKNYHTAHPTFPHETTVDQWFTESQFESYRELGYHEVLTSLNPQPPASVSSGGDALLSGLKPQDASVIQAAAMTQTAGEAPWPDTAEGEQALRDKKKSKLVPQCKQMKDSLERFGFDVSRLQSGGWKSS